MPGPLAAAVSAARDMTKLLQFAHGQLFRTLACALILVPKMYPLKWSGNELNYLGLARHHFSPTDYSPLFAVFNNQLSRTLSDYPFGFVMSFLGVDEGWFVLRIACLLLLAAAYARMTRLMEIGTSASLLALLAFSMLGTQAYFAGELIFEGVEAKTLTYALAMLAIGHAVRKEYAQSMVLLAIGTCFHFLIGLYWALAVFLLEVLNTSDVKSALRRLAIFVIAVSPILTLVWFENARLPTPDLTGINLSIDQIYSQRHPHHLIPFHNGTLLSSWQPGIIAALVAAVTLLFLSRRAMLNDRLTLWLAILHGLLFVGLGIAYLDQEHQFFGKFYMFRPAAMLLLLTCLVLAHHFLVLIQPTKHIPKLLGVAIACAIAVMVFRTVQTAYRHPGHTLYDSINDKAKKMVELVKANTAAGDVVLFEEGRVNRGLSAMNFEQLVDRPTLVTWKFVPTTQYDLVQWHRRLTMKKQAFSGDCQAIQSLGARYLVTHRENTAKLLAPCATEYMRSDPYVLFVVPNDQ
jgi:hypothetical protein